MKILSTNHHSQGSRFYSFLMLLAVLGLFGNHAAFAQTSNPAPYCRPSFTSMTLGTCSPANPYNMRFLNIKLDNIYSDLSACYGSSANDVYRYFQGTPTTTLTAGAVYTITAQTGFYASSPANYPMAVGAWIDYNRNDAFETSEWIRGVSSVLPTNNTGAIHQWSFTVPCNISPGKTRFRMMAKYSTAVGTSDYCFSYSYGECVDYDVVLSLPTSLGAKFIAPADAWVKSVVKFINGNPTGYIQHKWDANNDGTIEAQNSTNFNYTWNTVGNKCVKLVSTNCLGTDSIVKCLNIKAPTAVPAVDFVADRIVVEQYSYTKLWDLSTNGPWQWEWDVYDSTTYATSGYFPNLADGDVIADPWGNGSNEFSQNPEFSFDVPGCYTVVMTCKNDVGPSAPKRKVCYITVTLPTQYNLGYGTYGPNNDNVVGSSSGTIFDDGGPNFNYSNNSGLGSRSYLQITPCNAKKIELTMTRLKFKDAGDRLSVWDGKSPGGPGTTLLATWTVGAKLPQKVVATSGSMYVLFESDISGADSGYAGSYTSELGPAVVPTPSFMPSSVPSYNSTPIKFTNTTMDIVGVPTWEWSVDDNQVPDNGKKDFNYTFYTDGQYKICLLIKSCVGNKQTCTTIDVVTPNQQTQLDFTASNRRPGINTDITTLTPISDNANRFEWTIFPTSYTLMNPPGSPSQYGPGFIKYNATPGDTIPKPRIKFTGAGCYTITLKAYNSLDPTNTTKTVVKNKFVCALDYCNPTAFIVSGDIGINRVRILDGNTELLNNYSPSGVDYYTNFTNISKPVLTYGKTYTLEVSRVSNVDPANRKGWIDWNIDGDFEDAGELLFFEPSTYSQSFTTTFTVPPLSSSFEGLTKMRLAINYNNENTTICGPITAGEYEDYGMILANDNLVPVITLKGSDTVRIEVGTSYTDEGATAYDASEGDISSEMTMTSDLDATVTGLYTVEYNVTDKSGNAAIPAIRTIIVVNDMTLPILSLNPGSTGCIEARRDNPPYNDPGATATDNKLPFNLTSSIVVTGTVDTRTIGNYTLTYKVQDVAGNTVIKTRDVCVADSKPPVILPLGDTAIQIGSVWVDQTIAEDAYDPAPVITKEWGFNGPVNTTLRRTYPVTYHAVDQSGNNALLVVRNYRVDDFIPPVIDLNTFETVIHDVRTPYLSTPASVTDNYYAAGQVSLVKVSDNVDPNVLGTYTEVYEAVDGSGNKARKTRTVRVVDREKPILWGEHLKGCVGENIWPMYGISTTDNYYSPAELLPLTEIVSQNVNPWEEGAYSITYRVTDPSGNTSLPFTRDVHYTYWPKCVTSSVDVNDVKALQETVNIYPNPSSGLFTIDLKGALAREGSIKVYNALGQMIISKPIVEAAGKFEIDLGDHAGGVYSVKLEFDGQIVTKLVTRQ